MTDTAALYDDLLYDARELRAEMRAHMLDDCPESYTDPPEPEQEDGCWYYGVWIPNGPEWSLDEEGDT